MKITTLSEVVIWKGPEIATSLSLLWNPNPGTHLNVHFIDAVIAQVDICNVEVFIHIFLFFFFY
jgi:hypothetical protein